MMTATRLLLAVLLLCAGFGVQATAGEGDPAGEVAPAGGTVSVHIPGADDFPSLAAPNITVGSGSEYLFVAGSAFIPSTSAATVTYGGAGCVNSTGSLITDLQLPEGSTIYGFRLYSYNNGASGAVTGHLTTYDGAGGFSTLGSGSSTVTTGYGDEFIAFSQDPVVANAAAAYTLVALTDADTRLCGIRIFYGTP